MDTERRISPKGHKSILLVGEFSVHCFLKDHPEFEVTEVDFLQEALGFIKGHKPDVILSNLHLPDASGLEVLEVLQQASPQSAIIVVTDVQDDATALNAVQLGAQDYLVQGVQCDTLQRSIRYAVERKRTETRLTQLAHFDHLTGLANRLTFRESVRASLFKAGNTQSLAVMFLDLDRFKLVNDGLGHDAGDDLLKQVAKRLEMCVREDDMVARLGGDEFGILIYPIVSPDVAEAIASRIVNYLSKPFRLQSEEVVVTTSVGIAIFPGHGETCDDLLGNADAAMYVSKNANGNRFSMSKGEIMNYHADRLKMESQLRDALEENRYCLHYQPQFNLSTGAPMGAEALLRLRQEDGLLLPPGEFIPTLEDTDLIIPVGAWVIQEACNAAVLWGSDMRVSVNLSARQFEGRLLLPAVKKALETTGLAPHRLELELTETLLMRNTTDTHQILSELKDLGIRIAIDDFGTGYSSLAYLSRFEVDTLKIDRSFVMAMFDDQGGSSIASAIIGLSHKLNIEVVAEGVETEQQLRFLQQEGCDFAQGFLLEHPLDVWDPKDSEVVISSLPPPSSSSF